MYLTHKAFIKVILIYLSITIIPILLLTMITYYIFDSLYINQIWNILTTSIYLFIAYKICLSKYIKRYNISKQQINETEKQLLKQNIPYYTTLSKEEKKLFSKEVEIFISEKEFIGVDTKIEDLDKIMIACSAIIPVFKFPDFEYDNVSTIILYPDRFNINFETDGDDRSIMGLVGIGNIVALSKRDLHNGFQNFSDRSNVGFHEFIHKVDDKDGKIDGIPLVLINRNMLEEWEKVVTLKMELLESGNSDFNSYGLTNRAEFFAVASEYYFEAPEKMEDRHPDLYNLFLNIFKQDLKSMYKKLVDNIFSYSKKIPRNSLCPCGSCKKYKHCCYMKL